MKVLLVIAWRNIWRHPSRSGVLLAAVVVGLWAGVIAVGAMNGMTRQRIDYLIESEIAHVQIHNPEFLAEGQPCLFIENHWEITAKLDREARIKSHTMRTIVDGMLRSPIKTSGVRMRGIDIRTETETTTFHENIVAGEYLDSETRNAAIVGQSLARDHNLRIGNRIVLTFEDLNRQLTSASFNIVGLFESASADFDRRNLFLRSDDLNAVLGDRPVYHEIAIMLTDETLASELVADLNRRFGHIQAQSWRQLSPELNVLVEIGDLMLFIVTMIIMLALAFGILNTMLMALFERMREIGMLLSIGMSRKRVFAMILLESLALTVIGAFLGIFLGWGSILHLGKVGINLERFAGGIAEIGWDTVIYPFMSPADYASVAALVVLVTLFASTYPACKAIRINPLDAAKDT